MNYLSITFLVFISVFFVIYYCVSQKYKYIVIFIASYIFYGYTSPKILLVLIGVTSVSYIGGLLIQKKQNLKTYVAAFFIEILILVAFKYTNFIIKNLNMFMDSLFIDWHLNVNLNIMLPVGLSFMVFQACSYLSDVYRGKIKAEINPLNEPPPVK